MKSVESHSLSQKPETQKAKKEREKQEAIATLLSYIKPGQRVYTVLRRVGSSGMSRSISVVIPTKNKNRDETYLGITCLDHLVAIALGYTRDRKWDGLKVSGAGMDMGFHLVYSLGRTLFPNGGDLKFSRRKGQEERLGNKTETDGGYLLQHEWI
jgi:hypothetical protein